MISRCACILILLFTLFTNAGAQPASPDFKDKLLKATTDSQKLAVYRSLYDFYKGQAGDSAKPYLEQGLQDFRKSGYRRGQGALLLLLSNVYNERGMVAAARDVAEQALNIYSDLNDEENTGKAHTSIGNAESYLGNYTDAVKHFLAALRTFEKLSDTPGTINTYLELGAANDFNGRHDKALQYYQTALAVALRTTPSATIVYLYNNIGLFYARNGQMDTALTYFEIAEKTSRNPAFLKARLPPLTNLGKLYDAKGDTRKALEYLYQARALAKDLNTREPYCRVLLEIGQIESRNKPTNISSLSEGLQIAVGIGSKRLQSDFLSALADAADRTGNYKEEVSLLNQSRALRDSIFNLDKAKEIANLQSEFELKRTTTQLVDLERSEHRNNQKKNAIIIIAVVLAMTLLTLLVFYTKSRRLNRELSRHEQELTRANAVKDRLFSIIGHDLKGPIGNIPNLLNIYRDEGNTDEERAFIMSSLEESAHASLETLEKLLSWGKQQIKGNIFNPAMVHADEIMSDILRLLGVIAGNKNILIRVGILPGTLVYADENQFKFILRNLVSNAVKFSHSGGVVEVSSALHASGHFITFSVKDDGIGIDTEMQRHIFEPYNESTKGTANEAGTSIGLMLCKEFVILNGGTIWVESEKGKGTTFFFTMKAVANAS